MDEMWPKLVFTTHKRQWRNPVSRLWGFQREWKDTGRSSRRGRKGGGGVRHGWERQREITLHLIYLIVSEKSTRLPDLEVIRNKQSQSRQKSVKPQQTETKNEDNSYSSDWWKTSSKVPNETWRDRRAESTQREQKQRDEKFWNRDSRIPRLKRAKSMSSINDAGTGGLLEVLSHLSKPIACQTNSIVMMIPFLIEILNIWIK